MACLFNSLSYFIKIDSYTLRQEICNYLEQNKPIIDGLETKDILAMEGEHYIENMRKHHTWGGAIEIQAACNIWNIKIHVNCRRGNDQSTIEFLPISSEQVNDEPRKEIALEWTGGHYEPVR